MKLSDLSKPEEFERLKNAVEQAEQCRCAVCENPIDLSKIHPDLREDLPKIDGELVHEDCYCEVMGAGIEEHPIHTPGFPLSAR